MTHTALNANKRKKDLYTIRLHATNREGLSIESFQASYIMQYANSLVGRQIKILAQVNVFHVHDLVDPEVFALTKAIGELTALLWFTEIRDMGTYLVSISRNFQSDSLLRNIERR